MPTVLRKPLLALLILGSTVGGSFAQLSASFTYQIACDRTVSFTNNSTGFSTVSWDFGDAGTSPIVSPAHQYATSGNYTITLTVTNGALASTSSQSITLYDPPGQSVSGSGSVCANSEETYSVASSGNNYQWMVSGGAIISGQGTSSINVQWVSSGTGTVQLVEINALGCTSVTTVNVDIHPLPSPFFPIASDSSGGTTNDRLSACFDDTKTYALIAPAAGSTYLWEITGGTIIGSNQDESVVVHWDTEGEGLIKITETSSFGCVGSNEFTIGVKASPIANFTTADICLGSEANFTDQSTGNPEMWHWDFGDGTNSYIQFPTHIYSSPGTYDVTLIVSASPLYNNPPFYSTEACSDDTTISISVDLNPGLPLVCPGTVCAGDEETYTTPAIAGATFNWVVTGGTVTSGGGAADNEVTIIWGNGPVGTISLQQTGGPGAYCAIPSVTEIPIVSPNPQINGPAVVCNFNTVQFDAPLLPGATYNWTVTGGTINYGQATNSISVYFNTTGIKTITLDVFHDLADCGGQDTLTVQVLNPFSLSASNTACANTSQLYTLYGTPSPSGYTTWNWTVTGGTIISGQGTGIVSVQWGSGTVGEITVDAPPGVYCNSREQRAITIKPLPPPAPLSGALNVCAASTVTYFVPQGYGNTWTVTGGTVISGGTGNSYATIQWSSGATGQITLKQEDQSSWPYCPTTTSFSVDISGNNTVSISGPNPVCSNSIQTYTSSSNASYPHLWQVTGGTILSGLGTNSITVQWGTGLFGSVSVTEQICNNSDLLTVEIITPNPPIIDTANGTCDGSSITLFVSGVYANYLWNTGVTDTSITISSPGTYSVTVSDAFGCVADGAVTLNAIPTLPVPSVTIAGAGPPLTPILVLKLTAIPAQNQYLWSTGWTRQSLFVSTAGTYDVTVTNEYGCTASASVVVTVQPDGGLGGGPPPTGGGICPLVNPDFTQSICNPIQFTNATVPPALAYLWDFGDGTYSWDVNPVQDFPSAGNYNVRLYATENGFCWSFINKLVNIPSYLTADFGISPSCYPDPIQFTDVSTSTLPITGWQWDFGDGNSSTQQNPSHSYSAPGTYIVVLNITDGICSDSFQDTVIVRDLIAQFSYQEACLGMSALFIDNSTGSRIIARWNWDFGDASSSNGKNPAHKYATTGSFNVTLTVTDAAGCTASSASVVNVLQFNAGNISYTGPTTFCYGDSLLLTAPSGAGYTYRWSTGLTTQSITAKETGTYYVVVTEPFGCKDTVGPVAILVYPPPFAYITANGPVKFCERANYTTLAANPIGTGFTYQWLQDGSPLSTSQTVWVYEVWHSGAYTLIATDNHGCKDTSAALTVDIYLNPPYFNVSASGPTEFCQGESVMLTAPAGYSYEWTNGSTTQSTTVFSTGRHQVTITDANGCKSSSGENINVKPLPDMRLVPYGCYDVCLSDSDRVYGPPGMSSYVWSNGEVTQSILIDAAGTYNLTATNSFGCDNSSSNLYISTTNFLGVDLGNDTSFCEGGSVTFDAGTGFTSYSWQDASAGTTFTADATGLYFVKVTDTNGCEGSDTVALSVFPNPVVSLNDTAICNASSYTLVASVGAGYIYLWNDNSTNPTLSVSSGGTYSVTVIDANACSGSDAAVITFSPVNLGVNLGNNQSFCDGGSITFDAGNGFAAYLWQDGFTTTSTFSATASGTYIVTVSDGIGCSASDTVALIVFQNPIVNLPGDTVICNVINLTLDAGGGFAYQWSDNSYNQILPVTAPGNYSVTITDANTCTAYDNTTISLASSTSPLNASAADSSICTGESVQLFVTGGTTYTWQPSATLDNNSISNPLATPTSTTEYIVSASDSSGCTKSDTVRINVLPVFSATVTQDTSICYGSNVQLIVSGGTVYNWSPVAGLSCTNCYNPLAVPAQTTDYGVTVSASGYCNDVALSVTVTVHNLPDPGLDSIITISYGSEVTFSPNGGMDEYDWTSSSGWNCEGCPNPTVSPTNTTTYTLQVTDSNGCKAFALGTVEVLSECEGKFFIPTAFSPNGDGHNDEFKILHPGDLSLIDFKVFNRWGEIVFETTDPNQGWDGFYKGDRQDLVVFAYYAQMTCGNDVKTLIGNVTLVH